MEYTKVKSDAFQTMQMNAGILVDDFTPGTATIGNILGATTGGIKFAENPTYDDFGADVDNCPNNTMQYKRRLYSDPVLSGNFVCMSAALAASLTGGGTVTSNLITPLSSGFVPSAAFDDLWFIGDYSDKNVTGTNKTAGYIAIHLKNAMNTTGFQWQSTQDGKGQFAFEFHGHYDATDMTEEPFEIYVKSGTVTT